MRAARGDIVAEPPPAPTTSKDAYVAPPEFRRVMGIFLGLSSKRPSGMGVSPISSLEIEAYARRHDLSLSLFDQELLDRIDRAFISGVNKALKIERQSEQKQAALKKGGASNGDRRK